jgi:hypothetical protein
LADCHDALDASHRRANYRGGAFVGEHGSWDRPRFNGYKVVFVPFSGGRPSGKAEDSLRDLRAGCKDRCAEGLDRGLGRQFHRSFYEQRLDERPQEGVQQLYLL